MSAVRMATEIEENIDLICSNRPCAILSLRQGDAAPNVTEGSHLLGRCIRIVAKVVAIDFETTAVSDGEQLHHEAAHDVRLEVRREVAYPDLLVAAVKLSLVMQFLLRTEKLIIGEMAYGKLLVTNLRQIVTNHEVVTVELSLLCKVRRKGDRLLISSSRLLDAANEMQEVAEPAAEETLLAAFKL